MSKSLQRAFGSQQSCFTSPLLLLAGMKAGLGAKTGEMIGLPTGACARVGSQQGAWQKGFQGLHCSHSGKKAEQEPRVPGAARCRVVRTTVGQIHTHYHHKPVEKACQRPLCWSLAPFPLPVKKMTFSSTELSYPVLRESVSLLTGCV